MMSQYLFHPQELTTGKFESVMESQNNRLIALWATFINKQVPPTESY